MPPVAGPNHDSRRLALALTLAILSALILPATAAAQGYSPEETEAMWQEALEAMPTASVENPVQRYFAWDMIFKMAMMMEHSRAQEAAKEVEGENFEASNDVTEAILEGSWERLSELAPATVVEVLRAEYQESEDALRSLVSLAADHPDDPLVVWRTSVWLQQAGDREAALSMARAYAARHPDDPASYVILHQVTPPEDGAKEALLRHWAEATPGSGDLVLAWLGSDLATSDPQATTSVVETFLAHPPSGGAGLRACVELMQSYAAAAEPARACAMRILGEPDLSPLDRKAVELMLAVRTGTGGDPLTEAVSPQARALARLTAASELERPERCDEVMGLLTEALDLGLELRTAAGEAVAMVLGGCAGHRQTGPLFLRLVRETPERSLHEVVLSWGVEGGPAGARLPVGAQAILEERLAESPDSGPLADALAEAYRVDGNVAALTTFLGERFATSPESLDDRDFRDLASGHAAQGDLEHALDTLENGVRANRLGYEDQGAELVDDLSDLYARADAGERADRFAAELAAATYRNHVVVGHLLAAREAWHRGDHETAVERYFQSLTALEALPTIAIELLQRIAGDHTAEVEGESEEVARMARRICAETDVARRLRRGQDCHRALLDRWREAAAGDVAN